MDKKPIPVTRTFLPALPEYLEQLQTAWDSGWLTNGGALSERLAQELAAYLQAPHLELTANGTLALQLAIRALDLRGEIITSPYSYVATVGAILWEGCDPVFVDIEDRTFCVDPALIESAITPRTCAILVPHVYGVPCDTEAIARIAQRHGLKVVYDAAHCFGPGAEIAGTLAAGDCSALSFHATKLFHSAEGGAVVCRDPELARRISLMKRFGHIGEDDYLDIGINAKLSELHAAMGLAVLPHLGEIVGWRTRVARAYDALLDGCGARLPAGSPGASYRYYPVVFRTPREMMGVREALVAQGIMPRRYFHPSLNLLPYLKPQARRSCPVSESVSARVLCLPLYHGLEDAHVERICAVVRGAMR